MGALWRGEDRRCISSGDGSRSALAGIGGNTLAIISFSAFWGQDVELTLQESRQHPSRAHICTSMSSFGFSSKALCCFGLMKFISSGTPQQGGPEQVRIHLANTLSWDARLWRLNV